MLKHRTLPKLRQMIPLLVLPVVAGASLAFLNLAALIPAGLWMATCVGYGFWMALGQRNPYGPLAGFSAMVMHLAWSAGFWLQLARSWKRQAVRVMTATQDSARKTLIDVCVCTYRRRELELTLRSIGALDVPPDATVRIVVADNDAVPSARRLVDAVAAELPFELLYLHCPAANISIARNACLDNSTGDFLAFIDDDETASSAWLAELTKTR